MNSIFQLKRISDCRSFEKDVNNPGQSNHYFACLAAFVKMEHLHMSSPNHFAMKAQLYQSALASAFQQLQALKEKWSPA